MSQTIDAIYDRIEENDNAVEIVSVGTFIDSIRKLNENDEGSSAQRYFRGQEFEKWPLEPSIFRNNMLSIEHELMQKPLLKCPNDFKDFSNPFDIMTKYQHYGMCTRLLDLTSNPLVALYFACHEHGKVKYYVDPHTPKTEEKEPYGVIYYTSDYYPVQSTDQEVKIIVALSKMDLSSGRTISYILDKLVEQQVINKETAEKWRKKKTKDFIDILQNNYMVIPSYSNERLKHQSGVFLLASAFSANEGSCIEDINITKTKDDLRPIFCERFFYVKGENKKSILEELDLYNINEATLFPELEHQLGYIRNVSKQRTKEVSSFTKYDNNSKFEFSNIDLKNIDLDDFTSKLLHEYIEHEDIVQNIKAIILNETKTIDWYKKQQTISTIKMKMKKYFKLVNYEDKTDEIVKELLHRLNRKSG